MAATPKTDSPSNLETGHGDCLLNPANDDAAPQNTNPQEAFQQLRRAIMAFCARPDRLKDKRAAVIALSVMLREAFCVRGSSLDAPPKRLSSNHDLAAEYVYDQIDIWAKQPQLANLFNTVGLDPALRPVIVRAIRANIPAEEIGVWLCKEFGEVNATREAAHCRRYIATKLNKAILDLSAIRPDQSFGATQDLQLSLDRWAKPTSPHEESLHYQMVVQPYLDEFQVIADQFATPDNRFRADAVSDQ